MMPRLGCAPGPAALWVALGAIHLWSRLSRCRARRLMEALQSLPKSSQVPPRHRHRHRHPAFAREIAPASAAERARPAPDAAATPLLRGERRCCRCLPQAASAPGFRRVLWALEPFKNASLFPPWTACGGQDGSNGRDSPPPPPSPPPLTNRAVSLMRASHPRAPRPAPRARRSGRSSATRWTASFASCACTASVHGWSSRAPAPIQDSKGSRSGRGA
jgi:hypothetical protein